MSRELVSKIVEPRARDSRALTTVKIVQMRSEHDFSHVLNPTTD